MRAILVFILYLISSTLSAGEYRELSVSGSDQWIPFAYATGSNAERRARGIAYDVVNQIGQDLEIPVKIEIGIPWARIEAMLQSGDLDILAGNYWNKERALKWIISDHFAEDDVRVFVANDRIFKFEGLDDLKGRRGLMPQSVSFGQKFDSFKQNLTLETVLTHKQIITMLYLGRADYAILPYYSGLSKIKSLGYLGQIVPLDEPVNVNNVHLSLSRNSPCSKLIDKINRIIALRKEDGTIKRIINSYH
jgi:polar amino acid transport system substrate-binding protein